MKPVRRERAKDFWGNTLRKWLKNMTSLSVLVMITEEGTRTTIYLLSFQSKNNPIHIYARELKWLLRTLCHHNHIFFPQQNLNTFIQMLITKCSVISVSLIDT